VLIVILMYASSGIRSGLGVMLLISLAGAALVSRGTLTLFYAALASIAVLLEQSYWVLVEDSSTANYVQPGLLSIGYFATALITNRLARRLIRARFVSAGVAGGGSSLVFLEDLSKLQEQAQQLKLAALGRLTANIAHEIRNPLSAIAHAGDLLQEEQRGPHKQRIVQIIR